MQDDTQSKSIFRRFDTQKDPVWERLAVERELLEDEHWKVLMSFDDEYRNVINALSNELYYLEYFYKSRYIELARTVYPKVEEETIGQSMYAVVKWIEETIAKESETLGRTSMKPYDEFRRDQKRKLEDMLIALTGKENAISILRGNCGKFQFGVLEFRFFSFLVDTYKHQNAWYLRRGKYSYMTHDYYICLRTGVIMLSEMHPLIGDPEILINKWNYDAKLSQDHLNNEIEKFKCVVDKATEIAYQSNYSKLYLDYLADIVSKAVCSIEEVFGFECK